MNTPRATYRLQFQPDFGFARAAEIIPYLDELGISDIYASPIFRSRPGSRHGYDCVDPGELNPELGSKADWDGFVSRLRAHGMGVGGSLGPLAGRVFRIGHMGSQANPALVDRGMDVLAQVLDECRTKA